MNFYWRNIQRENHPEIYYWCDIVLYSIHDYLVVCFGMIALGTTGVRDLEAVNKFVTSPETIIFIALNDFSLSNVTSGHLPASAKNRKLNKSEYYDCTVAVL